MKFQLYTFLLSSIILIASCNSSGEKKSNSSAIAIEDVSQQRNDSSTKTSDIENLIGSWFQPHNAGINIQFQKDGRFEFNDYNAKLDKSELLTGNYRLENGVLTLLYDDRPKQNFKFYKGSNGDDNYYIKKGSYYFVKE